MPLAPMELALTTGITLAFLKLISSSYSYH